MIRLVIITFLLGALVAVGIALGIAYRVLGFSE